MMESDKYSQFVETLVNADGSSPNAYRILVDAAIWKSKLIKQSQPMNYSSVEVKTLNDGFISTTNRGTGNTINLRRLLTEYAQYLQILENE